MRLYAGRWYVALRLRNDLCVGVGRAPGWMRREALRDRPNLNIGEGQ
jgi:hypothetical protein